MQHTATINKIIHYEVAILDDNVSSTDFSKYVDKISSLREQLFYSLADKAKKDRKLRKLLIEDAVRFVQVEEVLLTKPISNSQFSSFLQSIDVTYENLQEFDEENVLLNNITQRLANVIATLKAQKSDRISDIYSLLYQIREQVALKTQN